MQYTIPLCMVKGVLYFVLYCVYTCTIYERVESDIKVLCPIAVFVVSDKMFAIAQALILHNIYVGQFPRKCHPFITLQQIRW